MPDVTVTCGCTRKMTPDTLRGKGAYRCGCGARVAVTIPPSASCLALNREGKRCPYLPIRESAEYGLSLCKKHLKGHLTYLETIGKEERIREQLLHGHRLEPSYQANTPKAKRILRLDQARQRGSMVVYYIRIGYNIKIGWTTDLKLRMIALMPDEILATEPGDEQLERARHKQFAHLRVPPGRERFKPDPELMGHIQMIREHFGEPSGTFPTSRATPETPELGKSPADLL